MKKVDECIKDNGSSGYKVKCPQRLDNSGLLIDRLRTFPIVILHISHLYHKHFFLFIYKLFFSF